VTNILLPESFQHLPKMSLNSSPSFDAQVAKDKLLSDFASLKTELVNLKQVTTDP
jgi:hypothetical protein